MRSFLLFSSFFLLMACADHDSDHNTIITAPAKEIKDPAVIVLADLPDSLKPVKAELKTIPAAVRTSPRIIPALQPFSHFTNFSTDHGLALESVSCSYKDKEGNIWFGTFGGGVSRYNGKSFDSFTTGHGLAFNNIRGIAGDNKGNIWFATYGGGVSRYDGISFVNYTSKNGLPHDAVCSIMADSKGNMWFGTEGEGVTCYNGASFETFGKGKGFPYSKVWAMAEDKNGHLWFGTHGNGVTRYDGKTFVTFTSANGLVHDKVISIGADKHGNVWFGTHGGGVSKYDGTTFTAFTTEDGLGDNKVWSIHEDRKGQMWFATLDGGVSKYDGETFTSYTTAHGLAGNRVWSITEDDNGSLWFGTGPGGVSRYNGPALETYTSLHGLPNDYVSTIIEDRQGKIWMATFGGGACSYDGRSFSVIGASEGLPSNSTYCVMQDRDSNIWIGTEKGVARFDGTALITFTKNEGLPFNSVSAIMQDREGAMWFGTYGGGVSRYQNGMFTNYSTKQGLGANAVNCILQDRSGKIWFGTYGGGLSIFDGKSFATYSTMHGLPNNSVSCIIEDRHGMIWLGTNGGGILRYDGRSFFGITAADGLASDIVNGLQVDSSGTLWAGTNAGLCAMRIAAGPGNASSPAESAITNQELRSSKLVFEAYNIKTGYPVKDLNSRALCISRIGLPGIRDGMNSSGQLWAGCGDDKVLRFDPGELVRNMKPPTIKITAVQVNDRSVSWHGLHSKYSGNDTAAPPYKAEEAWTFGRALQPAARGEMLHEFGNITFDSVAPFYPLPVNMVLPYEHNSVTFSFNAVETARPGMVNYSCILEGYDKAWSPASGKAIATFGNIPEGEYTFKVKAQSPFGVWSEPSAYTFTVLPPWYRTWWMYSVYACMFAGTFYAAVQWNGRRLRKRAQELSAEVDKATRSIVEQKNVIEVQKQVVEQKQKEILDSINYASRIQGAILPSMEAMLEALRDGFVLYMPKDVVAGDFYWMERSGSKVFFAAADCTGHGVPGAMVSVVCSNALSKALLEEGITETGKLLDRTRELVIDRFARSGEEVKDGMDISLCAIDFAAKELQWSGAYNPLWIVRNKELIEYKPDKQPIGKYTDPKPFTTYTVQLIGGETLYIFTDGYSDQFGGPQGKKFKYSRLKQVLLSMQDQTMMMQKEVLQKEFLDWKGEFEQLDDVCVIGVRV